ncbi:hypothetical protein [Streptomyces sp. NPDC001404]|uniref:hypothetical protein n=1 Tax=Streptomyces sp. NPDC001404 TaxID=3364571 RepID=UPI0036BC5D75
MVQCLHQAGQAPGWPLREQFPARIVFGPHTPTDRAAVLDEVVTDVTAGVMSLETAIRMLQDAGYPIEDAREEVQRIDSRRQAQAHNAAASSARQGDAADGEADDEV